MLQQSKDLHNKQKQLNQFCWFNIFLILLFSFFNTCFASTNKKEFVVNKELQDTPLHEIMIAKLGQEYKLQWTWHYLKTDIANGTNFSYTAITKDIPLLIAAGVVVLPKPARDVVMDFNLETLEERIIFESTKNRVSFLTQTQRDEIVLGVYDDYPSRDIFFKKLNKEKDEPEKITLAEKPTRYASFYSADKFIYYLSHDGYAYTIDRGKTFHKINEKKHFLEPWLCLATKNYFYVYNTEENALLRIAPADHSIKPFALPEKKELKHFYSPDGDRVFIVTADKEYNSSLYELKNDSLHLVKDFYPKHRVIKIHMYNDTLFAVLVKKGATPQLTVSKSGQEKTLDFNLPWVLVETVLFYKDERIVIYYKGGIVGFASFNGHLSF